ncbi:N-acetylgalactosaminide beta-1,3-galactosyltransferase [Aphelenchoides fujianensis]|nr:N-acetylgalactosaminide beta-1,3-galactosyltransferase [Aphelenchoides fujianensis]
MPEGEAEVDWRLPVALCRPYRFVLVVAFVCFLVGFLLIANSRGGSAPRSTGSIPANARPATRNDSRPEAAPNGTAVEAAEMRAALNATRPSTKGEEATTPAIERVKRKPKEPRIHCWITTWDERVDRALAVNQTWAKHCDKTVFVTPPECLNLSALETGVADGRNGLWNKTRQAFKAIYEKDLENFDYFMKGDDDVFVQVPRLRAMLAAHSPDDATYFGCRFKPYAKQGYMSGGAGYVISRWVPKEGVECSLTSFSEALRRFGEGLDTTENCGPGSQPEDLQMGRCLEALNVTAMDTRDEQVSAYEVSMDECELQGRHRMFPLHVAGFFHGPPDWLLKYLYYEYPGPHTEKAEYLISVHYVDIPELYRLYKEFY